MMKYRIITQERVCKNSLDEIKDYNVCLQKKNFWWWKTLEEYRPYNAMQAIKDLDFQRKINS